MIASTDDRLSFLRVSYDVEFRCATLINWEIVHWHMRSRCSEMNNKLVWKTLKTSPRKGVVEDYHNMIQQECGNCVVNELLRSFLIITVSLNLFKLGEFDWKTIWYVRRKLLICVVMMDRKLYDQFLRRVRRYLYVPKIYQINIPTK